MSIAELPTVTSCSASSCGYNHDGCHAPAITVGSSGSNCATFMPLGVDGGLPKVVSHVGACQRTECAFNEHALCGADHVKISGEGTAHCETYEARA